MGFREKKTDPAGAGPLGAGLTWLFERAESSQRGHEAQGLVTDPGRWTSAPPALPSPCPRASRLRDP
jgi:hypothetical protein